jgi:uncharacterized protein YukJ
MANGFHGVFLAFGGANFATGDMGYPIFCACHYIGIIVWMGTMFPRHQAQ